MLSPDSGLGVLLRGLRSHTLSRVSPGALLVCGQDVGEPPSLPGAPPQSALTGAVVGAAHCVCSAYAQLRKVPGEEAPGCRSSR